MSDTPIDTGATGSVASNPVAPPSGGDTQGSTPASADTAANEQGKPEGEQPDKQARRDSRAFATYRRENRELQRSLGRMEAEMDALRAQKSNQTGDGQPPRQERSPAHIAMARAEGEHNKTVLDRIEKAGEAIEDFEEVMDTILASDFPINRVMRDFLGESEKPALMAQWLAENPNEARRISRLSEAVAVRTLERAEAKLQAKPAPRTSNAPPPVPTVGGRSTASFDPKTASMDEYAADWKRRQAKR